MSEDARAEYARRLREGLRRRPLASPIHDAVAEQMTAALTSAGLDPPGARTILSLSAPYSAGKSTMIKRWAQGLHCAWLPEGDHEGLPRWSPSPGILADVIPVFYLYLLAV